MALQRDKTSVDTDKGVKAISFIPAGARNTGFGITKTQLHPLICDLQPLIQVKLDQLDSSSLPHAVQLN